MLIMLTVSVAVIGNINTIFAKLCEILLYALLLDCTSAVACRLCLPANRMEASRALAPYC